MKKRFVIGVAFLLSIAMFRFPPFTGIAAAAIYISAMKNGKARTQKDVARVSGVTEVTIRNRYKEISKKLGIDDLE